MPSQAHAGAAQEAPNIGQWEGQDVPLVRPSSCIVKGGIPSSRRYLPTYLDRLGLTGLGAMVDVEPYGSSDLGGDPSDDEPPLMTSALPSEDDNAEDPENPSGKKKKKKKKTRRPGGRRSQEAKAIAISKIVVNLPEFTGKDLS